MDSIDLTSDSTETETTEEYPSTLCDSITSQSSDAENQWTLHVTTTSEEEDAQG